MRRREKITVGVFLALFVFSQTAFAQMINYARRNQYLHPSKPLPQWMQKMPAVTNDVEQRYDTNRDGWLQTAEVKVYLRDVLAAVDADGYYKVDSPIVKEYDKNKDGYIDRAEAKKIKKDVD